MEVLDVGHGSASLIPMMKGWMLVEIVSIVGTFYAGKMCLEGELIWRRNQRLEGSESEFSQDGQLDGG